LIKVGLTGGIACGKSSVANWFAEKGIPVIDADRTVHELMEQPEVVSRIEKEFGSGYLENGRINRVSLGRKVFSEPEARKRLEGILHPLTAEAILEKTSELEKQGFNIIILEVPLLFEVGWDRLVDEVWVVDVSPDIQKKRLTVRNGFSPEEAEVRIASQMPLEEKAKRAHIVINNSGTWEETQKELEAIFAEIIEKHQSFTHK